MAVARETLPWQELLDAARGEQLVTEARYGARPPERAPLPPDLHPLLAEALRRGGVESLWSHQAEAYASALAGHTIVTTGTASGKSLAFNLPVLDVLARDRRARALYLYPTKALAQDQLRSPHPFRLSRLPPAPYGTLTPREPRSQIRKRANPVLTAPDMLHLAILPHHGAWAYPFAKPAVVVVD